jgi:hypothetical protein
LIEVLDFSNSKLTYKGNDVAKAVSTEIPVPSNLSGPHFRHVYNKLLGPTFPGEYIQSEGSEEYGTYVLSYPGIAFSFPVLNSAWPPEKDFVSLLSSSATQPASSMAIFVGQSWIEARQTLYTHVIEDPKNLAPPSKLRETYADEVGVVKIFGEGRLELSRPWSTTSFWLTLGETTPQELVAELGPPDAIYRKNDQRMMIHKSRTGSETRPRRPSGLERLQDDSTDTDQSSHNATDMSEEESEVEEVAEHGSGECFYNYFYHGFDILISPPTESSRRPPSTKTLDETPLPVAIESFLVATKIILHSNVPGSYSFNRHRRCRWEIDYLKGKDVVNSETPFDEVAKRLQNEWKGIYASPEEAKQRQRGMVLNRGWGDSPGSSVELLGGWEDSAGGRRPDEEQGLGNTTLYGFPGLVFEVSKIGMVSGLTVF